MSNALYYRDNLAVLRESIAELLYGVRPTTHCSVQASENEEEDHCAMKKIIKSVLARMPYRVVRNYGINRFQAISQSLVDMRRRGYRPSIVIDGGAHLGTFSLAAERGPFQ